MAATIYAYSSNNVKCTYTLSASRSGNTVTITASGTIYGNGSSSDSSSGEALYAQLRYGVSPSQTYTNPNKNETGTTTYVSNYGTLLTSGAPSGWTWNVITTIGGYSGTKTSTKIADNSSSSYPHLNSTGFPTSGRTFTITWTAQNNAALNLSNVALFFFRHESSTTAPSSSTDKVYTFIGKKDSSLSANQSRYYTQSLNVGVGYTDTGAPTSVTTSKSRQKPGANVVINWSGATAGASNSINGYQVYGGTSQNPTTLIATVSSTSTSSSYTYTIPSNATRGATYYFRIKTTGSAGSGYYSEYSAQATCKVNRIPTLSTCSASPTIISRNSSTSVTFTLSGAANDGTLSFKYSTSNSTSNTTDITSGKTLPISSGTSNVTYYFWAYDELEYSSSQSITLTRNSLPTITNIASSKNKVVSTGENVTFTITANANNTGQSLSYYYSNSTSGSKTPFSNGNSQSLAVNSTTPTYYFWVNDGLDFSVVSSKTIQVNTKPNYSISFSGGNGPYNSTILTAKQNDIYKFNETATISGSASTYQWFYQMSNLGNDDYGDENDSWVSLGDPSDASGANTCSTNKNELKERGKIYRLKCTIKDSMNEYWEYFSPWRVVAPAPRVTAIYNNGDISDPSYVDNQSDSTAFKNKLIFNLTYDNSLSSSLSSSTISSGTISGSDISYNNTTARVLLEFSNINAKTSYTISFTINGQSNIPNATIIQTLSTAKDPEGLTLTQPSNVSLKPFSNGTSTYEFDVNNIKQLNYHLTNDVIIGVKLRYENGTSKPVTFTQTPSTGNYTTLSFTQEQVLDNSFIPDSNWNTDQIIYIDSIIIKDIFGFSHTVEFFENYPIAVTFKEGFITSWSQTDITSINGKTSSGTYYIYQGTNQLIYNIEYQAYNTNQSVSCEAYIYRSNSIISDPSSISNWGNIYATSNFTTGSLRNNNNIVSGTVNISFNVDTIIASQYLYFKLILTLNDISTSIIYSSDVTHFKGVKHIEPTATIEATIVGDNTVISLVNSDCGVDPTNKMRQNEDKGYLIGLQVSGTNTFTTSTIKYLEINQGIGSLTNTDEYKNILPPSNSPFENGVLATFDTENSFGGGWERYYVRLIYRTFDPNSLEKIGYSSPITIFNMSPTVSYRQNRLGINTKRVDDFNSTGSVIIGAMNENSKIYILKNSGQPANIDLYTGEIDGFIIDSGEW